MKKIANKIIFETEQKQYSIEDLILSFKKANLVSGDSIFIHSDLRQFGKLKEIKYRNEFILAFIEAFLQVIGLNGNIIVPTFTYSFCNNEIYNPETSASKVGIFSEYFRKMPGVLRSLHPIFSVAAIGPKKKYFTEVSKSSFGENSIFHKVHKQNVKLVFLGETFDITFMHYIEQKIGVPYRFMKFFSGKIALKGEIFKDTCDYYVKYLNKNIKYDLEKIATYFDMEGVLTTVEIGYSKIRVVEAVDAARVIEQFLKKDIFSLLKSVPDLRDIRKNYEKAYR